ncbi:MAG: response regulator [Burkholderiaceae bacterium]|nr:response regulator [Burkholderiaceae bacterium]
MISTLLVVDDSKSSRKVNTAYMRELLGDGVTYLEAAGGQEALTILEERPVDAVLLDLTMPGMSGYDVLAEMQRRKMRALRVVISADVQKQTRERVSALGASGFLPKPLKIESLREVFADLELLGPQELFTEDERDQLGEIVNIAMGKAGATLAEAFSGFVNLRVPEIRAVGAAAAHATRERLMREHERVSVLHQEFFGELSGDIAVIYGPASYAALREVLGFDDRDGDGRRQREELLLELGNALSSTCILEISTLLNLRTGMRAPRILAFDAPCEEALRRLFGELQAWNGQTLLIDIIFHLESHDVPFELMIALPAACLNEVKRALAQQS